MSPGASSICLSVQEEEKDWRSMATHTERLAQRRASAGTLPAEIQCPPCGARYFERSEVGGIVPEAVTVDATHKLCRLFYALGQPHGDTLCTALFLLHRFCFIAKVRRANDAALAAAVFFLASKIVWKPPRLQLLAQKARQCSQAYQTTQALQQQQAAAGAGNSPTNMDSEQAICQSWTAAILSIEYRILHALEFNLDTETALPLVRSFVKTLMHRKRISDQATGTVLLRDAENFATDSYRLRICMVERPPVIALASIHCGLLLRNVQLHRAASERLPEVEGEERMTGGEGEAGPPSLSSEPGDPQPWHSLLDSSVSARSIERVANEIALLYDGSVFIFPHAHPPSQSQSIPPVSASAGAGAAVESRGGGPGGSHAPHVQAQASTGNPPQLPPGAFSDLRGISGVSTAAPLRQTSAGTTVVSPMVRQPGLGGQYQQGGGGGVWPGVGQASAVRNLVHGGNMGGGFR
uniref:Cyclin N-terminal domain-containing protein n=1 Tax=Chromera velia CCMP2878 TaxID=1169474 RepID=A0A0G4GWM1_9ALVE|eukprot:Cvel_5318.t1-p1 / transcript=Cvel_5318.t1 / gene=Cvel_5318 / organism=Chromera_velia_CCMP2878 / gene_product=hypothetical protein / transcript_product=hypothetical protein / location=Cvel_scaffold246:73947-82171(+) / protein_length=465 / sequence_SO=supercontig / SO=protein_coding / is_pseudo=false